MIHPKVEAFLKQHPNWSLDQCIEFLDAEIKKIEGEQNGKISKPKQ